MGYRSDVKALIYPVSSEHSLIEYDKLKTLMNTTFKDVYDYWQDPYFTWDDKHRVLKFDANSIKWYDGYPEVEQFGKFLSDIQELEYEYEIIRVGEEDTDIEYDSTGDAQGYLSVSRTIEVNF
jgi:hypothetical protein